MNCAIYTRVSTDTQAEKEFSSCEIQEEKISALPSIIKKSSSGRTRTCDHLINSQALYQLSYAGTFRIKLSISLFLSTTSGLFPLSHPGSQTRPLP